jgi:hypothetical protein
MRYGGALLVFSITALVAAWRSDTAAAILTPYGLGPVRIGMTIRQAENALGATLEIDDDYDKACGFVDRKDGRDENVAYMVEFGRITRIDVFQPDKGKPALDVTAGKGVRVGASGTTVRRAFGARVIGEPHPYDPDGRYFEVPSPGRKRGFIFEIIGGRIDSFRAGRYPAVAYIEGCE